MGYDSNDPDDNGTMPENVDDLRDQVVGHRIVSVEEGEYKYQAWGRSIQDSGLVITLDNGKEVILVGTNDCCAYTELESFLLNPELVDHVITGVSATDEYTKWHIFADMGDILELTVGWSCGNPFYYSYGFDIHVVENDTNTNSDSPGKK
jgi:hypothetical protein